MTTMATVKVSISLDEQLLAEARRLAPDGNLSAYIAKALLKESKLEAAREWLAEREAEDGPVPPEITERVEKQWAELRSTQGH